MSDARNYEPVVLSSNVNPLHYDLKITPNLKGDFMFNGQVDISLLLKAPNLKSITLHSKELTLDQNDIFFVSNSTSNAKIKANNVQYDEKATTVTIGFEDDLPQGEGSLSIGYTGCHNNQMAGFYRSGYTDLKGEKQIMVSTQFESLDARRCFPCVDEPARKATFGCSLVIDKHLTGLSNMPVKAETEELVNGVAKKKLVFETSPKMSTYLLAFCVGEFDFVEATTSRGVLLRVYTPPGKKSLGEFGLQVGVKSLDLYDDMFGQPFPLPKMDMIGIPEFAMGAMENWGLVTYREVDLLIDAVKASSQQKQRVCIVVAHELAHQWFGNLVTMAWWDDLWLNEGFASWMENYASDKIYPEWSLWEQFVADTQAGALSLDALATSHPVQVPIKHAEEVEEVFDAISYNKGSCIVRLAHAYLGHEKFVEGLQLYMARHKYENTETEDLWKAWEEVSNLPMKNVMSSWTEQVGFPLITVLNVTEGKDECTVELEQRWFLADGSIPKEAEGKIWKVPIFVVTEAGSESLGLFEEKNGVIKFTLPKNGWFKLNAGQSVPVRVNYTEDYWKKLEDAIKADKLTVVDRSGIIMDAYALTKAGELDPGLLLQLASAYLAETSYPVWESIAGQLHGINDILIEEKELQALFQKFAGELLLTRAKEIGWDSKISDGHLDKLLRAIMVNLLAKFASKDPEVFAEAKRRFDKYIENPNSAEMAKLLPTEYRSSVIKMVLKESEPAESEAIYHKLRSALETIEDQNEKVIVLRCLGWVNSQKLKLETLDWATSGQVKLQDFFYPIVSVRDSGEMGLNMTWKYFQDNFTRITEMVKTASVSILESVIYCSASGFNTEEKALEIEAFFKKNPTRAERGVSQLVEATRNRAMFRNRVVNSETFVKFLQEKYSSSSL